MLRRSALPVLVAAAFLTLGLFPAPARPQTRVSGVPAPMSFEAEGVAACLVVGNFDALLEHLDGIGRSFSPEFKPGMLRERIGLTLGDPGLKSLEAKKPIVLWVLEPKDPGQIPPVALHLPVKDQSPLESALQGMGLQVKAAEGILRASHTPEGLAAADKLLPA